MKAGVVFIRTTNDQNGRVTDFTLGDISFDPNGNPMTTGNALADALLGNFRNYSEQSAPGINPFRSENYEAFVSDTWRVSNRLSLELGARYQHIRPLFATDDGLSTFDPALYDPARAVTVNPDGTVVAGSGDPFNGLIRAGDDSRDSDDPALSAVPFGAARGIWGPANRVAPRASFAWTPFGDSGTAIRGGIGVFYDSPRGATGQPAAANPPFLDSVQFENGNLADPAGGRGSAKSVLAAISTLDRGAEPPRTTSWSVSIQRELPGSLFGEIAYVGNRGRNLLREPDINRASFEALAANAALPPAERVSTNVLRPFRGFSAINESQTAARSNYDALQLFVSRRRGLVTFTGSYTWSKALTDASGGGAGVETLDDPGFNYGPASFHREHVFVTTFTLRLPWWRDRPGLIPAVLARWEVSGIGRLQSGGFSTVTGNTSIGTRRADDLGGGIALSDSQRTVDRWFNTEAFSPAPDDRRGTAGVGTVQGPGLNVWDLTLRKRIGLPGSAHVLLQVDFFNVFNRTNFLDINTNATALAFGSITSAAPPRQLQLGARFTF